MTRLEAVELARQRFEKSSGVPMDAATVEYYRTAIHAFDSEEWRKPKDIGVDFHLADTLHAFGLLEKRTVNRFKSGTIAGQYIWFRRVQE